MASLAQLQVQIFRKEGFRVVFEPLDGKRSFPPYEFEVMASNRWRVSDWRMQRLIEYIPLMRAVTVLRGDERPAKSDMRLGNLRDTYFAAEYGTAAPPEEEAPVSISQSKKRR